MKDETDKKGVILESYKTSSGAGLSHQNEFHQKLRKFRLFSQSLDSPEEKRHFGETWDSLNITETVILG